MNVLDAVFDDSIMKAKTEDELEHRMRIGLDFKGGEGIGFTLTYMGCGWSASMATT